MTSFLGAWASQGVLLLNTCLTVRAHQANSHAQQGWEEFTQAVIDTVNQHGGEGLSSSDDNDSDDAGVVFLAWGKPAEKRVVSVNKKKHLILTSPVSPFKKPGSHSAAQALNGPMSSAAPFPSQRSQGVSWKQALYSG